MRMTCWIFLYRLMDYAISAAFARNIETHVHLRTALQDAGGKLESPSIEFGDDSDSRLVEHLLASVAAHQREKNAEQVQNRIKARMQNGYYFFYLPPGYAYTKRSGYGKILVRDEPVASIITEALEGFASGKYESISEVKRFFISAAPFPKDKKDKVHFSRVKDMLINQLYSGYLTKEDWGIHLLKGKHEALISYETYQRNQDRLKASAKAPARKNINEDFPLRGFVTCVCCHKPMTSCWTKGRSAIYPYYFCKTKGCTSQNKGVRGDKMEAEFETLLQELKPSVPVFMAASAIFSDIWDEKID